MPPRRRRYDDPTVRAAVAGEWAALRAHVDGLADDDFRQPTALGDWGVGELVAHIAAGIRAVHRTLARAAPSTSPSPLGDYLGETAGVAPAVADRARDLAAGASPG